MPRAKQPVDPNAPPKKPRNTWAQEPKNVARGQALLDRLPADPILGGKKYITRNDFHAYLSTDPDTRRHVRDSQTGPLWDRFVAEGLIAPEGERTKAYRAHSRSRAEQARQARYEEVRSHQAEREQKTEERRAKIEALRITESERKQAEQAKAQAAAAAPHVIRNAYGDRTQVSTTTTNPETGERTTETEWEESTGRKAKNVVGGVVKAGATAGQLTTPATLWKLVALLEVGLIFMEMWGRYAANEGAADKYNVATLISKMGKPLIAQLLLLTALWTMADFGVGQWGALFGFIVSFSYIGSSGANGIGTLLGVYTGASAAGSRPAGSENT